jgi:hypothetical protein
MQWRNARIMRKRLELTKKLLIASRQVNSAYLDYTLGSGGLNNPDALMLYLHFTH